MGWGARFGRHFYWEKPLISYPQPAGPVRGLWEGSMTSAVCLQPLAVVLQHQEIGDSEGDRGSLWCVTGERERGREVQ